MFTCEQCSQDIEHSEICCCDLDEQHNPIEGTISCKSCDAKIHRIQRIYRNHEYSSEP